MHNLLEICTEAEQVWRDYLRETMAYEIEIPQGLTKRELEQLSYSVPSVLDEVKVKLGMDPTKPMANPHLNPKGNYLNKG